jgi:NAD(P)-dependent dehydrogenase (short-subunit alcohol dehydrogenase family)
MTSTITPVSAQLEPEPAGQTVLVIGGSGGIGPETVRPARAEAADLILTGRKPGRLKPSVTCRAWPRQVPARTGAGERTVRPRT